MLFPKSVDAVMAAFTNTLKKLEQVAAHHDEERDFHYARSDAHKAHAEQHGLEMSRARAIAAKLRNIITA